MYRSNQLSTEFRMVVKGNNFMTPHVVGFYGCGDYICELSSGTDFDGNKIYGVTVVNGVTKEADHDKSQMFHSLKDAKAYMKGL